MSETHYRDMNGTLLWKDDFIFRRLFSVGQSVIQDGKTYFVRGCALGDEGVVHVNVVRSSKAETTVLWQRKDS